MSTEMPPRAWIEIDGGALRRNFERLRDLAGGAGVLPVVKTNAYGLGFREVVDLFETLDPWGYGIADVSEGRQLRALGVRRPAILLSPVPPATFAEAIRLGLRPSVSSLSELDLLLALTETEDRDVFVHLEIDSGIGRAGFLTGTVEAWGPEVIARTGGRVKWEGVYTHFRSASQTESTVLAEQVERFDAAVAVVRALRAAEEGGRTGDDRTWIEHLCNSAGLLRRPDLARSLVRPGLFLYGGASAPDLPRPDPVVALRARIVLVKRVPAGTVLGYGGTYEARRDETWATVAVGYGDGLPRGLENRGFGLIADRRVPIVGRISMGMTVVDITDLPRAAEANVGTEVTFLGPGLGPDGGSGIPLEEVATLLGTSQYELLTGLPQHLPRIWT